MQLKRLEEKEKNLDGYPAFFANQPLQLVRAEKEKELKDAQANLRAAADDLQVAEVTGEGLAAAREAHAIAHQVVAILSAPEPSGGANLTAKG